MAVLTPMLSAASGYGRTLAGVVSSLAALILISALPAPPAAWAQGHILLASAEDDRRERERQQEQQRRREMERPKPPHPQPAPPPYPRPVPPPTLPPPHYPPPHRPPGPSQPYADPYLQALQA